MYEAIVHTSDCVCIPSLISGISSPDHYQSSSEEGLQLDSAGGVYDLVSGVGGVYGLASGVEDIHDIVSATDSIKLENDLEYKTKEIERKFNVFFTKVRRALEQKGVSVADILKFLGGTGTDDIESVVTSSIKPLLAHQLPRLRKMESFGEVFQSLMDYCSWFNHELLDDIIEAYCEEDESVARAKERFHQRFHTYCKHRVRRVRKQNGFGHFRRKKDSIRIHVKVDRKWNSIRVEQISILRRNIAEILKVRNHTLYLCTVEKGCVQLLFLVPAFVAEIIFPLAVQQEVALSRAGIFQLTCGDYHFPMLEQVGAFTQIYEELLVLIFPMLPPL